MKQDISIDVASEHDQFCVCCGRDDVSDKYFKITFNATPTTADVTHLCKRHLRMLTVKGVVAMQENKD